MIRILVAMEREGKALGLPFEVINIFGTSIPPISPSDIIVNVGYCGGDGFKPGTIVEPKQSSMPKLENGSTCPGISLVRVLSALPLQPS